MTLDIEKEVAAMQGMTTSELADKYAEVFGECTKSRHRQYLVKRIAWRMQANIEGDLTERAKLRAAQLANDADLRVRAPRPRKQSPGGLTTTVKASISRGVATPMPGTVIVRKYKGEVLHVNVLPRGFEYEGQIYRSLSALAKKITGSHINGLRFFRLGNHGGQK
jgi:hypothetical protein